MQAGDIFSFEGLSELGSRNGADMRPSLLRVLTDLYVHRLRHTPAEERHYTELALRLLDAVDVSTRIAVAKRLARYPSPPLQVVQRLADDVPEVAAELKWHAQLQAAVETATARNSEAAGSRAHPAANDPLPAEVPRIVDAATANRLNDLFFAATAQERRLILMNLNIVAPMAAGSVRISRNAADVRRLETAVLTGKTEDFARQLAQALHIPFDQASRLVRDDSGEGVIVAAKALGLAREVLYRILMFLNPAVGHSVERVHALAALYDELPVLAAEGMIAIWQALPGSERARTKHRPLAWDDDAQRRARPAASARLRAAAPAVARRRSH